MPRYDVVAFDLDGTLLRGTTVSLLTAAHAGREADLVVLERDYAAGRIGNDVIAAASNDWLTVEALDALDDAPWIDGIDETVEALHETGAAVLVATITWRAAAERLADRHGFDAVCGTTSERVCDEHDKAAFVVAECERRGVPLARMAAVGDSRSDLPLFERAGLAIAFNGDARARAAADIVIDSDDLRSVLDALL